jgi:hypothetical protein
MILTSTTDSKPQSPVEEKEKEKHSVHGHLSSNSHLPKKPSNLCRHSNSGTLLTLLNEDLSFLLRSANNKIPHKDPLEALIEKENHSLQYVYANRTYTYVGQAISCLTSIICTHIHA